MKHAHGSSEGGMQLAHSTHALTHQQGPAVSNAKAKVQSQLVYRLYAFATSKCHMNCIHTAFSATPVQKTSPSGAHCMEHTAQMSAHSVPGAHPLPTAAI